MLRERGAEAVLGGGGYVAGPAGLAALALGLPLVLTEADRHLGLTNRLLARRARRVCLAFPIEGREGDALPGHRPPGAGGDRAPPIATRARERFGIAAGDRCLLVFGGSQGARSINLGALEAFAGPDGARPRLPRPPHQRQPRPRGGSRAALDAAAQPGPLHAARLRARPRRRARRLRPRPRPRRRLDLRDRRRRAPGDPRPLSARGGRATSTRTRTGWPTAAPRSWSRTPSSSRRACARSPASCSATRRGWRRMARGRARARPPRRRRAGRGRDARRDRRTFGRDERRDDWSGRELHFIAIGGAGMSGLALVCHALGARVTGCDRAESSYLERVARGGDRGPRRPRRRRGARRAPRSSSRPRSPTTTRSWRARASAASGSSTAASCSPSSAR